MKATGFGFGVAFGFVLGWARLTDYDVIHDMLLLREGDVYLLMMSAMVTAACGVRALRALQMRSVLDQTPIVWTTRRPRRDHVIGSVLFGIGWSIAGTCPGPVAAQLGRGQLAAAFTIAGIVIGLVACDRVRASRGTPGQAAFPEIKPVVGL